MIPGVAPLLLAAAGAALLAVAWFVLRAFGARYRVGRLLAAVPAVPIADAVRLATEGVTAYIRVDGRIDSDAEFEDEHHRPLVLRRMTLRWRTPGAGPWTTFDTRFEAVPFVVREGMDEVEVDAERLGDGLVVVPRLSVGQVADLGERAPEGVPREAEASMTVEHVSSVEHATVLGVPRRGPDGRVVLGPGMGRPLILTTLERDEAMRVLTGGAVGRSRIALACLVGGVALLGLAVLWWVIDALVGGGVAAALAASPDPTQRPGADTRTSGSGPGIVGEPVLAVLAVLGIGLASLLATLGYVRLTRPGRGDDRSFR
jgi:hypothetical protein